MDENKSNAICAVACVVALVMLVLGTFYIEAHGEDNATSSLFSLLTDNVPVLVVKPDGTVLVRGVAVEKMNTEEAKQAWRDVSIWVARQYQGTTLLDSLNKQTDYLLKRVEECERRCK